MRTVGLARRAVAVVVDALAALVIVSAGFAVGVLDPVIFRAEAGWFMSEWWLRLWLDDRAVFTRPVIAWIAVTTVWIIAWQLAVARTPGDRVAQIEVVDSDGDPPSPLQLGLRAIGLLMNVALGGLGWLWCVVAPSRRTLPDLISGTFVASSRR